MLSSFAQLILGPGSKTMNLKALQALLLAGAASALLSTAALAADAADFGADESSGLDWDISFGVTVTSDYVARGISYTDGGPAVQPEAEISFWWLYAGWWGSNVTATNFSGSPSWENDFSVGIRPEFGPVSLDIGHVWYTFNDPADNGAGEAYIQASVTPMDPVTIGAQYWMGTGNGAGTDYAEINGSVDFMEHFSASAAVGWIIDPTTPYTTWNAGFTWTPVDPLEIDFRYHYAPSSVGGVSKFVVSASVSSSLRSLGLFGAPPPPP